MYWITDNLGTAAYGEPELESLKNKEIVDKSKQMTNEQKEFLKKYVDVCPDCLIQIEKIYDKLIAKATENFCLEVLKLKKIKDED